jgi:DNA-binding NtrC family response regulator/pSer/pThr/pTyr-binding forkhead associated (FHA) protein
VGVVSAASTSLWLVVARGEGAGNRIAVDETPRVVGRARGVDLMLEDLRVSRRHLEVSARDGAVHLRVLEGAAPVVVGARQITDALLAVGERIVVGDTVLAVVGERPRQNEAAAAGDEREELTDVATMLGGLAEDVRGLSAVFALTEALDAADHDERAVEVIAGWAREHLGAVTTTVVTPMRGEPPSPTLATTTDRGATWEADAARAIDTRALLVRASDQGGTVAVAPAMTQAAAALVVTFAVSPDKLGAGARRLLVVAARLIGSTLSRMREVEQVRDETADLRRQAIGSARSFLGQSPAAEHVAKLLPKLAASEASVLISGESGTGKTFVARLIHEAGPRAREPLRILNCAAIPETLLEAELFGHERGAFTGAVSSRAGAFEAAGTGTVLLDEIGELAATSQAKLLRVLEERRFERLGSNRTIALRARILCATNRDLAAMVEAGKFRADLFFRISVVNVHVPPLRERGDDVVLLANAVLEDLARTAGRRVRGFTEAALEVVRRHSWPGNVRELRNAIEHALVLGDEPAIAPGDLPDALRAASATPADADADPDVVRLPANLAWLEARAIEAALRASGGNRTRAAALLGINRATLYKKRAE